MGRKSWSTSDDVPDDQVYTFDDVPKYRYAMLRGTFGYIIDKGDHVRESLDARHLILEPVDESENERVVHEKLINKYLYEGKRFWVDWNNELGPHRDRVGEQFPQPIPVTE